MNIDPDTVLPQVQDMLYKLAWETTNKYPVEFSEALSEAYYAFVKACESYDPSRSKFSTWCYFWAWTHLKTWVTKRSRDRLVLVEEVAEEQQGTTTQFSLASLLDGLSDDAKQLVSLLLSSPSELGEALLPRSPQQLLRVVRSALLRTGWSKDRVKEAEKEVRCHLRASWSYA